MRLPWYRLLSLAALTAVTALGGPTACGGHGTYVKTDQAALGRVVVYRNGIAYYERRARVQGDTLDLTVPNDKVDDFLKSLTVTDARTGKALPVSFPTRPATESSTVEMTIQLPSPGPHDLVLTYIIDAPAWKPSYRVMVQDDGQVELEGWAIVDNTSGEDWNGVRVGVGSSSALSFRYDLRSVRSVHRELLGHQEQFAVAPPKGGAVHQDQARNTQLLAEVADLDIPRPPGHPDAPARPAPVDEEAARPAPASRARPGKQRESRGAGFADKAEARTRHDQLQAQRAAEAQRQQRLKAMAAAINQRGGNVVIEGFADPGEPDPMGRALDRANTLKNHLVQNGVSPARLQVVARGAVAGQRAGVRVVEEPLDPQAASAAKVDESGRPVGESHFESQTALTVKRGTSAMVSMVDITADGAVVYLYDAEADRGSDRFAFRAVRLRNPTESTLESGPVTFYGDGRFIGEGLTDPIPPRATAVIPFALDRQVVVEKDATSGDRISRLVTLQRGVLTAEVQHARKTKLKLTNRLHKPATVYVRHTVRKGWTLTRNPKLFERLGEAHLFEVALKPGETTTVEIEEATPLVRTLDLRSDVGVELVRVWLEAPGEQGVVAEQLRKLLAHWNEIGNHEQAIDSLRERVAEYRTRVDELHGQILSLKAAKAGGELMRHLQKKMEEVSSRIQKATIDIVDHQQKVMLARIRFQDGVAELSLADRTAKAP